VALIVSIIMNLILIWPFKHVGLAIAVGTSAIANGSFLYWGLCRKGIYKPKPGWVKYASKVLLANIIMAALLWGLKGSMTQWLAWHTLHRVGYLLLIIILGAGLYFAALYILGFRKRDFIH
jgi:putative peptidoglycan lipid II flippase